jgi:hypothetical protein
MTVIASIWGFDMEQDVENVWYELNELESLGIRAKDPRMKNSKEELAALADVIKKSMYQDYKLAYSEKGDRHEEEAKATVEA